MRTAVHSLTPLFAGLQNSMLWLLLASLLCFAFPGPAGAQQAKQDSLLEQEAELTADLDTEPDAEQDRLREMEIARQLELRRGAIDELQGEEGIYGPSLLEAYADLGALYEEIEDYGSAVRVYFDALQISRINDGLYSERQIPIIQSLIDSNGELRNWGEADDLHELRYHISSRIYDIDDLAYLDEAQHYANWKLRTLRENLLGLSYRNYSRSAEELSFFYERLIANLDLQPNNRPENMIELFQGKSETDLVLVRAIASTPYTAFEGTVSRYVYEQRCRNVRSSSGQIVRECASVQVENPRYRQSQVDAKRFAMDRSTREVQQSIDRLRQIYEQSDLSRADRDQLESQIAELETQTYQLLRQSRSRRLF